MEWGLVAVLEYGSNVHPCTCFAKLLDLYNFLQPFRTGLGNYLKKFAYRNTVTGKCELHTAFNTDYNNILQRTYGSHWKRLATSLLPQ